MTSGPERSRRAARAAANDPGRYLAKVDPVYVRHLRGLDEPAGITRGGGEDEAILTAAAVAYLQQLPWGWDCHVDSGRRWIYFEGRPHPLTRL
ncbi:hypothetical protein PV646_17070 [Streptomyces sp. ID05-26A]|nr:hypothetical protein [Streptomyces sp. ID05-26A]